MFINFWQLIALTFTVLCIRSYFEWSSKFESFGVFSLSPKRGKRQNFTTPSTTQLQSIAPPPLQHTLWEMESSSGSISCAGEWRAEKAIAGNAEALRVLRELITYPLLYSAESRKLGLKVLQVLQIVYVWYSHYHLLWKTLIALLIFSVVASWVVAIWTSWNWQGTIHVYSWSVFEPKSCHFLI